MFLRTSSRLAASLVLVTAMAACSPGLDTRRVDNRASGLEGQKASVLRQCMGDPHAVEQTATGETWRYAHERVEERKAHDLYGGTPGVIIRVPASTERRFCVAEVKVENDIVQSITFSGDSGNGMNRRWACMPLMANC